MAYVYRHIRIDKNEPFYIGIGEKPKVFMSWGYEYHRAFTKRKRNNLWHKIAAKTEYLVEILFDEISWEEACKKEIELIAIYGRINNETGILANLTDGGSGAAGVILPKEAIEADILRKSVPLAQYDLSGKFLKIHPSIKAATESAGSNDFRLTINYKTKPLFRSGFYWKKYTGENCDIIVKKELISSFDKNGDYIKTYKDRYDAANDLGIKPHTVWCLYTGRRTSTVNSIRLRIDNGNHCNIGTHEYKPNCFNKKIECKR